MYWIPISTTMSVNFIDIVRIKIIWEWIGYVCRLLVD